MDHISLGVDLNLQKLGGLGRTVDTTPPVLGTPKASCPFQVGPGDVPSSSQGSPILTVHGVHQGAIVCPVVRIIIMMPGGSSVGYIPSYKWDK